MEKKMSYNFAGGAEDLVIYWNGKTYGEGKRYVEVRSASQKYGKGCKMTWSDGWWVKNAGMPYAKEVAQLLGFC